MQSVVFEEEELPKASFIRHGMVARCRADTETVTPQSRRGWRWRVNSEHTWVRDPKLVKKRRKRRREERKGVKGNQDLT